MSVNIQDGSGDSGCDAGVSAARAFSRHQTSWSINLSPTSELLEIPATKNHTATLVGNEVYVFGGYDGQRNHNDLYVFDLRLMEWRRPQVLGVRPSGRNGHSATLVEERRQILILGGWPRNGSPAADMYLLSLDQPLRWVQAEFAGDPPGPCNMHTADLLGRTVLVFRGGDGRAYLNDLHGLDLESESWYAVRTTGEQPPPRANHASAVDGHRLYIFGGWDGTKRLNDLYVLDSRSMSWSPLRPVGCAPQARAGMTLSIIRDCLYLFGGSGHTTRCFNDVHVYDPKEESWFLCASIANEQHCAPERRAGHVAVAVDRRLFISGGACGTQYYGKGKWFILDIDAPPAMETAALPLCEESVRKVMSEYLNTEEFSDVVFVIEGRRLFAHRVLLALFSDYFRRFFSSGMRESFEKEVHIKDVSYEIFYALLELLYRSRLWLTEEQQTDVCFLMGLLRAADQFCVDCVKQMCERHLSNLVDLENVDTLLQEAERVQAPQLQLHCEWFKRQQEFTAEDFPGDLLKEAGSAAAAAGGNDFLGGLSFEMSGGSAGSAA